MSIQTLSIAPDCSTSTTFNAWGSAISAALSTAGLTKATDTGQVNWASNATVPTTTGTYEIWKFADSLQSTAPVFIRLDYYDNSGTISPQMALTVGTGSNGAGTITGVVTSPSPMFWSNTNNAAWGKTTPVTLWVDSDGGSSMMIAGWFNDISGSGTVTVVERSRNWDGTVNGNGVGAWASSGGFNTSASNFQVWMFASAGSFLSGGHGDYTHLSSGYLVGSVFSRFAGSTYYPEPVPGPHTPMLSAPSKHAVLASASELPVGTQFTASLYGVTHTYVQPTWPNTASLYNSLCPRIA